MKKILLILLALVFVLSVTVPAFANSECNTFLEISKGQAQKGEEISLRMYMNSLTDISVATFRVKLYFDSAKLKFKGIESEENIDASEFKYYEENNTVTLIYLESSGGIDIKSGKNVGILDFKFKVLDNASTGQTDFSAKIDGIGDNDVNEIFCSGVNTVNLNILDPIYSSCRLKSLEVSDGILVPGFDPYITEYNLSVPYDIKSIEVYASPQDSSDNIKVNRKTLGSGGSCTDINVTVTSQDKKTSLVYKINTYRGLKESSSSSISSTSKTSTAGTKGTSNASNSSGSNLSKANGSQKSVGSEKLYSNTNGEPSSILVKNNTFLTFVFGTLISAAVGIIIYIIYRYKNVPKGKHEFEK